MTTVQYAEHDTTGKNLLVTGGASGVGAATARRFAAGGGRVAIVDRNLKGALAIAAELPGAVAAECDISDPDQVQAAVRSVTGELGDFDYLVNAAGVARGGPFAQWTLEQWNRLHSIHVGGAFLMCQNVLPGMQARGGGAIVLVSSIAAHVAQGGNVAYGAAKAAVVGMTVQLARDLGPSIRVNAVAPGRIRTPMSEALMVRRGDGDPDKGAEITGSYNLLKRVGMPDDIAAPICFLLSDASSFITGQELIIDGGETVSCV